VLPGDTLMIIDPDDRVPCRPVTVDVRFRRDVRAATARYPQGRENAEGRTTARHS
jgi:hypothetical protein